MSSSVADKEPPATPGNQNGEGLASPMPPMPPPPFNTPCGTAEENGCMAAEPGEEISHGVVSSSTLANKLAGLSVEDASTTQAGGEQTAGDGNPVQMREAGETEDDDEDEDEEEDDDDEDDEDDEDEEDGDGDEVDLPPEVMKRLYQLKALQSEKDVVYAQYKEERAALESKFGKLYGAIYAQRTRIVSGRGEDEPRGTGPGGAEDDKERGVPHFWMQCMLHHEALRDVVCEGDLEALYYLSDVRCLDKENLLGFTLEFHFDGNPFFSNLVLRKRYDTANIMDQGEPLLEGVEGTKIEWKAGRNLCERIVRRRAKRGGRGGSRGGEARMVPKVEKTDSFFKFFLNPMMYEQEDDEDDDEDQYNFSFDMDYEIARIFRNHLIPNAVLWFTGEAVSEDEDEDEDDDDDDEGLEDTDGLSDEEGGVRGDGNRDDKVSAGKTLNFQEPPGVGAPPSGDTQECKQS